MPLKNPVALERRIDLASLFCAIGRHGPAVALAVVAMVLFLAGCRLYRSFREKRRKNAATADDRDGNAGQRDAGLGLREEDEPRAEGIRRYKGSTDGSDENSQDDLKEDIHPSHRPLKIRRRRAAAKRTPNKDKQPDIKSTTPLDKTENSFVWDINPHKAAKHHAEEVSHILESDFTKNTKDVIEETSVTKETELIDDVSCKEEEKVLEAVSSDNINTTKEDVSEEECRQDAHVDRKAVELVLPPEEVNTAEEESGDQHKTVEKNESEPLTFEQDASSQRECEEIKSPVQIEGNLTSDLKDNVDEAQPIFTHNKNVLSNTADQIKGQSSTVDSCHKECKALIPSLKPTDVIKEETSDFKAEISSITDLSESLGFKQNTSLQPEQLDRLGVSPVQDSHDNLAREKDPEMLNEGVIEKQESKVDIVYLNTAAQVQEEMCRTAFGPERRDFVKVESEHETPNAPEQKEFETPLDKDNDIDISKKIEIQAKNNGNGFEQEVITEVFTANVQLICDDELQEGNVSHLDKQTTKVLDHEDINETKTAPAELVSFDRAVIKDMSLPSPVFAHDRDLPVVPDQLLSLDQMQLEDDGLPSPGLAGESGISSMTVSPDLEEADEEICATAVSHLPLECDRMLLHEPLADCKPFQLEEQENKSHSPFLDDAVAQVTNEDPLIMMFGPFTSSPVQLSPPEDISYESLATNEDTFGSEVEDSYHRAADEFLMQVIDNILNVKDEVKKQTKQIFSEVDEEKKGACVVQKEEGEEAEDCQKTEINIMEATMDHNEWITDGNYQVHTWMNVSCVSKDNTKNKESTDVLTSVENKPTAVIPFPEENIENAKRVLAVLPMPQNVNVTFRIHYCTLSPDQAVAITGDQQELGSWKSVVPLEKSKDGYWSCVVSLPAESHVEWKFVVLDKGQVCRWEECGNRLLYTGYGDDLLVHRWWGFL